MTAILNTNTSRELKVLQKRGFQGKKKSEGSRVHCKSWQLLTLSDLLTWRTVSASVAFLPQQIYFNSRVARGVRQLFHAALTYSGQEVLVSLCTACMLQREGLQFCSIPCISEVNSAFSFSFCQACIHVVQNWP